MGNKLKIGQVLMLKRKYDNETVSDEFYYVERFFPRFVQCRHIKGGYTETFTPYQLFRQKIFTWRQVLEYSNDYKNARG